jgi:hypothetical protein
LDQLLITFKSPKNKTGTDLNGRAPIPWNIFGIFRFSEKLHYSNFMVVVLALTPCISGKMLIITQAAFYPTACAF